MGKAKRAAKRARKQARGTAEETEHLATEQAQTSHRKRMKWLLWGLPVAAAIAAGTCYVWLEDARAAGLVVLGAALVWLPMSLGFLGSSVPRRDRGQAGSIRFGGRR